MRNAMLIDLHKCNSDFLFFLEEKSISRVEFVFIDQWRRNLSLSMINATWNLKTVSICLINWDSSSTWLIFRPENFAKEVNSRCNIDAACLLIMIINVELISTDAFLITFLFSLRLSAQIQSIEEEEEEIYFRRDFSIKIDQRQGQRHGKTDQIECVSRDSLSFFRFFFVLLSLVIVGFLDIRVMFLFI